MTLDDETAALIEEADGWEVAGNRYATGLIRRLTDALKAGYAYRDAEVEELRAERDAALATLAKLREYADRQASWTDQGALPEAYRQRVLAILDESPTDVATALTGASDMERIGPDFATTSTERETPADEGRE